MASDGSTAEAKLANAKAILTTVASFAATLVLARSVANDLFPPELREYFYDGVRSIFGRFSSHLTMVIVEMDGLIPNQIYEAAHAYLATKIPPSTNRLKVSKPENEDNITTTMESNQQVIDTFNGLQFHWLFVCSENRRQNYDNPRSSYTYFERSFELCFHKKHKEMVLKSYLPRILLQAKQLKQQTKTLKIFTADYQNIHYESISDLWIPTNLDHPATFDKLAMDSDIKDFILRDLERFVKRKEFYRKVGKAWKRGYLLYGPPGTGKSSLIAAMANYLKFDVYDLELTELESNSDLRKLLMGIGNRSILVVEDIDCSIQFRDRMAETVEEDEKSGSPRRQVTLSGLLNFIDGLWSSCGDERIIIFTTNHKEKLDPALLRPGRMDVHVHLSYCSPCGFKVLASNYLGIENHELFGEIEESISSTKVTPAEVAEQLLKSDDGDKALREFIEFLEVKKRENEEAEAKIREAELEAREKEEEKKAEKKGEENGTAVASSGN